MEFDELRLELNVIVGQYDTPRFHDGPTQGAFLNYSVGMTCKGLSIYIPEYPTDHLKDQYEYVHFNRLERLYLA